MGDIGSMLEADPAVLAPLVAAAGGRVLLFGEGGTGKSTLAMRLGASSVAAGVHTLVLSGDPGTPAVGPPGAVALAEPANGGWRLCGLEALCTLDAGRFRLPLVTAIARLVAGAGSSLVLIDAPGVASGSLGAEVLSALVTAAAVDLVLLLMPRSEQGDAIEALDAAMRAAVRAAGARVQLVRAAPEAVRVGPRERAVLRTQAWDAYLRSAVEMHVPAGLPRLGSAPFEGCELPGRQIALLARDGTTLALGEALESSETELLVRSPAVAAAAVASMLARDAARRHGLLSTVRGPQGTRAPGLADTRTTPDMVPRPVQSPPALGRPVVHVASAKAVLVNGVMDDPLLHVRLRHKRRSLLFDLGEAGRLQARIAHQVTDVFISHAHFDHIAGFLWLLRSRIGVFSPCRIFGPPGVAENIEGLVRGIHWDRVSERAPVFQVAELHDCALRRFEVRAGRRGVRHLEELAAPGGVLLDEPDFRVRAALLDHGTPVLAYAYEETKHLSIRKERLLASGLQPGRWLSRLKQAVTRGEAALLIELPHGGRATAAELAAQLVIEQRGQKLVYATDLADTAANRQTLVELARGADALFCEATFIEAERRQAQATSHLTARACGEIAHAAGVGQLVPFHLSRRYDHDPALVYREVLAAFERVVVPPGVHLHD